MSKVLTSIMVVTALALFTTICFIPKTPMIPITGIVTDKLLLQPDDGYIEFDVIVKTSNQHYAIPVNKVLYSTAKIGQVSTYKVNACEINHPSCSYNSPLLFLAFFLFCGFILSFSVLLFSQDLGYYY